LKAGNLSAVRSAIQTKPEAARHPRAIVTAAGQAFLPVVKLLHGHTR